jgi:hypothetical protein
MRLFHEDRTKDGQRVQAFICLLLERYKLQLYLFYFLKS